MQLLKNCESQETHKNRKQVKDEKMILSISKIVKTKMVTLTCDRIKKNQEMNKNERLLKKKKMNKGSNRAEKLL